MQKQILVNKKKKKKKKHWLKGCPCREKFAWLAGESSGNFSGEILVNLNLCYI